MQKKKIVWQKYATYLFRFSLYLLAGILCGKLLAAQKFPSEPLLSDPLLFRVLVFLELIAAFFIQVILHEAGHLVFGMLSGYKFISFRIFRFIWIKSNGKLRFGLIKIPGTGGQCLLSPPDLKDGRMPFALYHLGGILMNVMTAAMFSGLFFLLPSIPFFSTFLLFSAVLGLLFAILNGVPLTEPLPNDGFNALTLSKDPEAMRCNWIQLKIGEQLSNGVRMKDMPEEWFTLPPDEAVKSRTDITRYALLCSRLMDAHQFAQADSLLAHMLESDSGLNAQQRREIICDRLYIELITENRRDVLIELAGQLDKRVLKWLNNSLSGLRTAYAFALLYGADQVKAGQCKARFYGKTKRYPYRADVQSECELMEIAKQKFEADRAKRT